MTMTTVSRSERALAVRALAAPDPSSREVVRAAGLLWCAETGRLALARGRGRSGRPDPVLSVPGGTVEPGEDGDQAVLREFAEELGLHLAVVPRLVVTTWRPGSPIAPAKRTLLYDLGRVDPAAIRRDDAEIAELVWVDPDELAPREVFVWDWYRIKLAISARSKPVVRTIPAGCA